MCDVGSGTAHLTLELLQRGLTVTAVEPNDAMRTHGITRTEKYDRIRWVEGTGESTGQPDGAFDLVTFGSSFNVTDRGKALAETKRILKPRGWFACMWNHRDLDDPVQHGIEEVIKARVPSYDYGTRREDQTEVINASGYFEPVPAFKGGVIHKQTKEECIEAWRSHGTLHRQAGERFGEVIEGITEFLRGVSGDEITIPYTTRVWAARLR